MVHYLDEKISVASWYPAEDMIGLVRVLIELMPETDGAPLVLAGQLDARAHVEGAYSHLFESPVLETLPLRANARWKSMHDSGQLRVVMDDGEAMAEVVGFAANSPEMCVMIRPYVEGLFRATGIEKVTVEKRLCCLEGASSCRYHVSWDFLQG